MLLKPEMQTLPLEAMLGEFSKTGIHFEIRMSISQLLCSARFE